MSDFSGASCTPNTYTVCATASHHAPDWLALPLMVAVLAIMVLPMLAYRLRTAGLEA